MKVIETLNKFIELAQQGKCPAGTSVNLTDQATTLSGLQQLAALIFSGQCPDQVALKLRNNNIDAFGVQCLATAIASPQAPQSLTLDLYANHIGSDGAHCIADILGSPDGPRDITINIENNNIGSLGAEYLAEKIASGQRHKRITLYLGGNNINAEGAQHFAQALATGKCPDDLTLDFIYSDIGSQGAQFIAHTLQYDLCPARLVMRGLPEVLEVITKAYRQYAKKWDELLANLVEVSAGELNKHYKQLFKLSKLCLHTLADAQLAENVEKEFTLLNQRHKNFIDDLLRDIETKNNDDSPQDEAELIDARATVRVVLNDWSDSLEYGAFKKLSNATQVKTIAVIDETRKALASSYITRKEWQTLIANETPTDIHAQSYLQAQSALAVKIALLSEIKDTAMSSLYWRCVLQLAQSFSGVKVHDTIDQISSESVKQHPYYQKALQAIQYARQNLLTTTWDATIERMGKKRNLTITGKHGTLTYRLFSRQERAGMKRQSLDDVSFVSRFAQRIVPSASAKDDSEVPTPRKSNKPPSLPGQ